MRLGDNIDLALVALRANMLRSALTMLGIVIGVAVVVAMLAIGRGSQARIEAQLRSLGTNLLTLTVPLYLLQLFDRVLTSRSLDTLWVLTLIAVTALLAYGMLEGVRRLLLSRCGFLGTARA